MNTMNNAQAQELTTAIISLTAAVNELIALAKEEETEATTTTATTETTSTAAEATTAETTTTTTAPIIVIDDDDNVIATTGDLPCPPEAATEATTETTTADAEFVGSMIENAAEANADTAEAEETVTADTEEMLDKIICDISTLYDVAEFALCHEGKNIDSDHSPYAPKDNRRGLIGDYQVFISKEITKDGDHIEGSFRLGVKDKVIVNPIMDLEIRLIDNNYKIFSSENVHRMEKMKEDHDLMRFLEITDEVSALVMSKYISK